VILEEIGMTPPALANVRENRGRPASSGRQGGRGPRQNDRYVRPESRRDQRGRHPQNDEGDEDRIVIERGEDAVDQREEERGEIEGENSPIDPATLREEDSADAPAMLETVSADEPSEDTGGDIAEEIDHADTPPPNIPAHRPPQDNRGPANEDDGPRRGRRRGRRGRGRGRGNNGPQNDAPPINPPRVEQPKPTPPIGEPVEEPEIVEEDEVNGNRADLPDPGNTRDGDDRPRRRRRRGGRRHRRNNEGDDRGPINQNGGPGPAIHNRPPVNQNRPAPANPPRPNPPVRTPPPRPTSVIQPVPVVRTGSADKHLASDEPVAPQPASRPHSYRDLDAIPDDYD
jgi:hypothetical protein